VDDLWATKSEGMQLISKISNLYNSDPPRSQTDRVDRQTGTDGRHTIARSRFAL